MVDGLEKFATRVLNNLWNAIQKAYPDEVRGHFYTVLVRENDMKAEGSNGGSRAQGYAFDNVITKYLQCQR